ncbi:metallophosphoesterase family protein [Undibacterium sp.]|jgi:predicted phosphodiesterase|uniref:metallophosphoesterase family protein n=1 Tax=Undibacterium sp. TaxID=1914977 RepID=UPI002D102D0B|nr:metallophosphoesterase family protein [Undibacterium sp.]HTD04439.1 metallophosphoesterase family protein [Undibacterium sp.]
MRIALLSDIHGNLPALQAVLQDLALRAVDRIVNLGDSLSGPLFPKETAEFLMRQDWVQLAGNHERQILEFRPGRGSASDGYALSTLTPAMLAWIRSLPGTHRLNEEVFLCHGTPATDLEYFLETVEPAAVRLASPAEVDARLGNTRAKVVACGHTHIPRAIRSGNGTLIVNPGSVGLQAYDDEHPHPHLMQNGSSDARYAIIEGNNGVWSAALHSVPYDYHAAADAARLRDREDWRYALLTGYALPPSS